MFGFNKNQKRTERVATATPVGKQYFSRKVVRQLWLKTRVKQIGEKGEVYYEPNWVEFKQQYQVNGKWLTNDLGGNK